jgi:hypothetical protein
VSHGNTGHLLSLYQPAAFRTSAHLSVPHSRAGIQLICTGSVHSNVPDQAQTDPLRPDGQSEFLEDNYVDNSC